MHWCSCELAGWAACSPILSVLGNCPPWEVGEATGAEQRDFCFVASSWVGFFFHTCSEKAIFRSGGSFLRRIMQDSSINLCFSLGETR